MRIRPPYYTKETHRTVVIVGLGVCTVLGIYGVEAQWCAKLATNANLIVSLIWLCEPAA